MRNNSLLWRAPAAITGSSLPGDIHGVWSNREHVLVVKSSPNVQGSDEFKISQL